MTHNEKEAVLKACLLHCSRDYRLFSLSGALIIIVSRPVCLQMIQHPVADHKLHSTALRPHKNLVTLSRQDRTMKSIWPTAELA
jgi:hypothetical protein